MDDILAPKVYEAAVAAGRAGANHSEAFNAGVMACLQGGWMAACRSIAHIRKARTNTLTFRQVWSRGENCRQLLVRRSAWMKTNGTRNKTMPIDDLRKLLVNLPPDMPVGVAYPDVQNSNVSIETVGRARVSCVRPVSQVRWADERNLHPGSVLSNRRKRTC